MASLTYRGGTSKNDSFKYIVVNRKFSHNDADDYEISESAL